MHANQWFELLNTIQGAVDDRRWTQVNLSRPTRKTNQR